MAKIFYKKSFYFKYAFEHGYVFKFNFLKIVYFNYIYK